MSIAGAVTSAIKRCGRAVTLEQDGCVYRFYACVQPRSYDTQARTQNLQSRFGKIDPRQFIYYGPLSGGGEQVREGSVLTVGTDRYEILLCHDFYCGGEPAFRWATARLVREESIDA